METFFGRVADTMRERGIDVEQFDVPNLSKGFFPRIGNILSVRRIQSDIVHVTGDINYAVLGGPRKKHRPHHTRLLYT